MALLSLALKRVYNPLSLGFMFGRGPSRTATRRVPQVRPSRPRAQRYMVSPIKLTAVEDRRMFHPDREARPFQRVSGGRATLRAIQRPHERRAGSLPSAVGFVDPARVLVCVRRTQRKRVLHALGIAGGTGFKPPRFNESSNFHC